MTSHTHDQADATLVQSFLRRYGIVFIAFAGIAATYLLFEHTAHVVQYLPFAIVLLWPLMHMFMRRGHGGHQTRQSGDRS